MITTIQARRKAAQLTRQFLLGRISNYKLEDMLPSGLEKSKYKMLAPTFIDPEFKLTGRKALKKPEEKRDAARAVLFLRSSFEYRWDMKFLSLKGWSIIIALYLLSLLPVVMYFYFFIPVCVVPAVLLLFVFSIIYDRLRVKYLKAQCADDAI